MGVLNYLLGFRKLNISKNDLVLEVGSGNHPFVRADVLLDKFQYDSTRTGSLIMDRPLVLADAGKLPFRSKSFEFVYCSHVLEHLENPKDCLEEMMRVGHRGIIITPSEGYEKIVPFRYHRWFVSLKNDKLILEQKPRAIFDPAIAQVWQGCKSISTFWKFYDKNIENFSVIYHWQEKIEYEIYFSTEIDSQSFETPVYEQITEEGLKSKLKNKTLSLIGKAVRKIYSGRKNWNLYELLPCPVCKDEIKIKENKTIACQNCEVEYPIYNHIPIMLIEESKKLR